MKKRKRSLQGRMMQWDDDWFMWLIDTRFGSWIDGRRWAENAWEAAFQFARLVVCWLTPKGHDIEDDHCGKPGHRMCYGCGRRFPNREFGPTRKIYRKVKGL